MFITVECGATWKSLYEMLKPMGLRTPYFGPMSGFASTVGGALSQGSIFLGSTEYGTTAESVLGLDVVLADGSIVTTGSAGGIHSGGPFLRNYGPDLTGLFLHDAGAFGLKGRATLRLISAPEFHGAVSFTFRIDTHERLGAVPNPQLVEDFVAAPSIELEREAWRDAHIRRLFRVITEDDETLGRDAEPAAVQSPTEIY